MSGRDALLSGLAFVVGLWLVVAPFALGYPDAAPLANDLAVGLLVALLALWRLYSGSERATTLNFLLGIWLAAGAVWIYDSSTPVINDLVVGVVLALLAVFSAATAGAAGRERR